MPELTAEEAAMLCEDMVQALVTHCTSALLHGQATKQPIDPKEFHRQALALALATLKSNGFVVKTV